MFTKNILKLQSLTQLPYFTTEDVANVLGIRIESARVFCSRYAKKGLFIKLKNNFYSSSQKLENISIKELISIANILQVPSYVSFMTAMGYHDVTSQVQRNFIESTSLKRSIEYDAKGITFRYYKLKKKYFFDFVRTDGIFIATKEKSFLDSAYLYSFGKYRFDINSLDLNKLDKTKIKSLVKSYPEKTKKIVREICSI
jgi:predicted transcriptional regulator of viral defense system